MYLISIISVFYNSGNEVEATIRSIVALKNSNIEYVIVDGGSTDETQSIISKYRSFIDVFVCEQDRGIYDAMNKGINLANGKYLCFINAGDSLLTIPEVDLFNSNYDLLSYPVKLSSGKVINPKINNLLKIKNTLPHQGCFYLKKPKLEYSNDYVVFSDFWLNQKIYKAGKEIKVFSEPIVAFHKMNGISNDKRHGNEIFKVVRNNFGLFYQILSWVYFKIQGGKVKLTKLFEGHG